MSLTWCEYRVCVYKCEALTWRELNRTTKILTFYLQTNKYSLDIDTQIFDIAFTDSELDSWTLVSTGVVVAVDPSLLAKIATNSCAERSFKVTNLFNSDFDLDFCFLC
mmetsp:Transcript_24097/g.44778  ORF Transcript_24097/g.44778 Transcript_24097/m.44778 type:complete len:108 (+) Transcript_24097:21-344(+)